jgi:hypothetical protein
VLIAYGVSDAFFSFTFGYAVKYAGRQPIFILGAIINAGVIVTFFTWVPNPDQGWVFFVLAALWGVGDAVWQTQINGNKIFVLEPSGIPIPILRDLKNLNPNRKSGFQISDRRIPIPFKIVFNLAPIFFLLLKRHQRYELKAIHFNLSAFFT